MLLRLCILVLFGSAFCCANHSVKVVFFDLGQTLVIRPQDSGLSSASRRTWGSGVESMLQNLKNQGIFLGIISNTGNFQREDLLKILPENFDFDFFHKDLILLSSEVGVSKPNAEIFHEAIRRAQTVAGITEASQCLFCAENLLNTMVAQQVGMRVARIVEPGGISDVGQLAELLQQWGEQQKSRKPLQVGDYIPLMSLRDLEGKDYSLHSSIHNQAAIVIFYRGGWCPYCNKHLAALQEILPQLQQLGYQVIAISPDKPEKLRETLEGQKLSYTLLSDSQMKAAKAFALNFQVPESIIQKYQQYGIYLQKASGESHNMLPVPSLYIVQTDGKIVYSYTNENYKIRLDASIVYEIAKKFQ